MGLYEDYRSEIKSGDLLAWSGKGWVGRLIRTWTGQTYSHVGIAWVSAGRVFVIEAREGKGVTMRLLSKAMPVAWISLGLEWSEEAETFALSELGQPYSLLNALRAGFGLLPRRKDGWQCAQYVLAVINFARGNELPYSTRGVRPGELVEATIRNEGTLRYLNRNTPKENLA